MTLSIGSLNFQMKLTLEFISKFLQGNYSWTKIFNFEVNSFMIIFPKLCLTFQV